MSRLFGDERVPAVAIGAIFDGELIYSNGYGQASPESRQSVSPETVFRIGSTTKAMTAAMLVRLVEEGTLDLDVPIKDYLPRLALRASGEAEKLTLRLLLSHRSGLPNGPADYHSEAARDGLEALAYDDVPRYPLIAPPGVLPSYSNVGLCLAAHVGEAVRGHSYQQLMRELVFEPLAMSRTTFEPTVAMTYPMAQSYTVSSAGVSKVHHGPSDNPRYYPGAYAFSTIHDLATFAGALLSENSQVFGQSLFQKMSEPNADWGLADGLKHGLCLYLDQWRGHRRVGHDGSFLSSGSKLVLLPDLGVGAVILYSCAAQVEPVRELLLDSILDGLAIPDREKSGSALVDSEPLGDDYFGTYVGPGLDEVMLSPVDCSDLLVTHRGGETRLFAQGEGIYESETFEISTSPWPVTPYNRRPRLSLGLVPDSGSNSTYVLVNARPYRRVTSNSGPRRPMTNRGAIDAAV